MGGSRKANRKHLTSHKLDVDSSQLLNGTSGSYRSSTSHPKELFGDGSRRSVTGVLSAEQHPPHPQCPDDELESQLVARLVLTDLSTSELLLPQGIPEPDDG